MYKKYSIYKLISPRGFIYIGQTRNLSKRLLDYFYIKENSKQEKISNEIVMYKFENFKIEILHVNLTHFEANAIEIKLIKYYKNLKISLNISDGGELDVREKNITYKVNSSGEIMEIYESATDAARKNNLYQSYISISNIRKTFYCKGMFFIYKTNYDLGMFEKRKIRGYQHEIRVIQLSLLGEFLAEFESIKIANIKTGVNKSSIGDCASGKLKRAGNFIWKFKSDYNPEIKYTYTSKITHRDSIKIISINKFDKKETVYNSIKEASKKTNISRGTIYYQLKNKTNGNKKQNVYFKYL